MCTGKCSKCIGITLFPLAACAIVSNILLYFPNGRVLQLSEITDLVWFFHGILGAGILVILPAFMMLGAGRAGCCANRCGVSGYLCMLLSVVLAVLGFAGGAYCVVISSLGLIGGPLCDTEPENIILWNIVLFSILLAIGVIEAILCFIQIINGLTGFICGTCMSKRK
ncbi:T4S1 protein, partial [Columbina picui]|nr:T4S1 protein [Columbina picui]